MRNPLSAIRLRGRRIPQSLPDDARQHRNDAGGFAFVVDDVARLRRFLVLGVDGGTYYASEQAVTQDNAAIVLTWARERGVDLVTEVVAISAGGRAPRHTPALFALAAAAALGDDSGRAAALAALPSVARTGTHLFQFAGFCEQFRGWGRGLRRAVGAWYLDKPVDDVAYQLVKYRQREGWTHRDLLRLAHPVADGDARRALFEWACRGTPTDEIPVLAGFLRAQAGSSEAEWLATLDEHPGLSWEMLPDQALALPSVWQRLLAAGLPQTALLRQLPRLTRLGVLEPGGDALRTVVGQLTDETRLRRARVHPVNVLVALRTYASGAGARSEATWTPVPQVVDALDAAFYAAFGAVGPAGRRTMLALDVSGSMMSPVSGLPLSCREASAAMSMVTMATEPSYVAVAFTSGTVSANVRARELTRLALSPRQRLDDVLRTISGLPFGGTDCAMPMVWAARHKVEVDTFVVYTDNETWAGDVHPHTALRDYRQRMGIPARLVVVGMTASRFTIADPSDAGMLDVAGFDSAVPSVISDFSRGAA